MRSIFMKHPLFKVLCLLSALFIAVAASAEEDAAMRLSKIREAYAGAGDLSARFTQTSIMEAVGRETVTGGTLELKRGGKMRWTYEGSDPQEIVSDGEILWIHQIRDKSVIRQPLSSLAAVNRIALDLLNGFAGLEDHFSAESCGVDCLELTPLEESAELSKVVLIMGEKYVVSVTTEDPLGNANLVELSDVKVNVNLREERFVFEVPENVDVMDMNGAFE